MSNHNKMSLLLSGMTVAIAGFLGQGCGSSNSCTVSSSSICVQYTGSQYTADTVRAACTGTSAVYSAAGCSNTSRVGRCTIGAGTAAELVYHYYSTGSAAFTAATAQSSCTTGTFAAN